MRKVTRLRDILNAASHADGLFHREVTGLDEDRHQAEDLSTRYDLTVHVDLNGTGATFKSVTFTATTKEGARRFALETLRHGQTEASAGGPWAPFGFKGWAKPLATEGSSLRVLPTGYTSHAGDEYRVFLFVGCSNTAELGRVSAFAPGGAQDQAWARARAWFAARAKDAASL